MTFPSTPAIEHLTGIDALVALLLTKNDTSDDEVKMRRNIARLDTIGDSFSENAVKAVKAVNDGSPSVRQAIKMWVSADFRIGMAFGVADSIRSTTNNTYSAANYILDDAVIVASLDDYYSAKGGYYDVPDVRGAHQLMLRRAPHLVPDLHTSTKRDVDSYCLPLGVTASILRPRLTGHIADSMPLFDETAVPFIAWAATQPDIDSVTTTALRISSLNPEAIIEFQALLKSTHAALHDGLL